LQTEMRVVTTGEGRPHPVGEGLTMPTHSGKSNTAFPSLPLSQISRTTVRPIVYVLYMLREICCYFPVIRPKSGGVRYPSPKSGGTRTPVPSVNYAYVSKREREDERPDETPVTVIDLHASNNITGLLLSRLQMLTVTGFNMVSFTQYLVVYFQETVSFSPFPKFLKAVV